MESAAARVTPLRDVIEPSAGIKNIEAGQALLGAMLINNAAHGRVSDFLLPDHFANAVHGRIYAAIGRLIDRGQVASPVTLKNLFDQDGALGEIGGAQYLARLAASAVTIINAESYGRALYDLHLRRELITVGQDVVADALTIDLDRPAAAVAEEFGRRIAEITASAAALGPKVDPDQLAGALGVHAWRDLDIPPEPKLLGDMITPSGRMFLVGRTGLGKTLLLHGLCGGMASGEGFLHWRSERPSRWLIIDGEMPSALIKERAGDLLRRVAIPPGNLIIYSIDRGEEFARLVPGLGILAPINTEPGHRFVLELANALNVEGIAFDNVMSLVAGDQKEEVTWSGVLPLITELSKRKIAQVYADHTGHNGDRQYGTSTKQWRFDTVAIMTPLSAEDGRRGDLAFAFSFDHPGKARRRKPENWSDFETCTIRLSEDRWMSDIAAPASSRKRLSPAASLWHRALLDALVSSSIAPNRTTKTAWYGEAARTGLAEPLGSDDTAPVRNRKLQRLRKFLTELRTASVIGVDGESITVLPGR